MNSFLSFFTLTFSVVFSITFENIAPDAGVFFEREPSVEYFNRFDFENNSPQTVVQLASYPVMTGGYAGVGMIDFNNDGHIDIMVPNGPNGTNALFRNNGDGTFTDVGATAGIQQTADDSSGVCFGDLNNDGYDDMVITGRAAQNYIYENNGDGTFTQRASITYAGGDRTWSCTCTLGDIDNDGDLDLFIGNSVRSFNQTWVFGSEWEVFQDPNSEFKYNDHNELWRNDGSFVFTDISEQSGIHDLTLLPIFSSGEPTITWSNAFVDINFDGNIDIIQVDDQAAVPRSFILGVDRGLIQILLGDGTGNFSSQPQIETGFWNAGAWMGISFGDLNCDNLMDFFVTSFGDYAVSNSDNPRGTLEEKGIPPFAQQLREFYGKNNIHGIMEDPIWERQVQGVPTVFGWGTAITDIDNDCDLDIIYYGGLDNSMDGFVLDNPGMILLNEGCDNLDSRNRAVFNRDTTAIPFDPNCQDLLEDTAPTTCTAHNLRMVRGIAVADINNDGFDDIISTAVFSMNGTNNTLLPTVQFYDNELDDTAFTWYPWSENADPNGFRNFTGVPPNKGTLFIEQNSGNSNNWAQIILQGGMGTLNQAIYTEISNRNGIGAYIKFYPIKQGFISGNPHIRNASSAQAIEQEYGHHLLIPVVAGESHASQNSFRKTFGLSDCTRAGVEVYWPNGYKNILYYVPSNEITTFYEIPISFDDCSLTFNHIKSVVNHSRAKYGFSPQLAKQYARSFLLKNNQVCNRRRLSRLLNEEFEL